MNVPHHSFETKYKINSILHDCFAFTYFLILTPLNIAGVLKLFKRTVSDEEFKKEALNSRILGVAQNLDFITYLSSSVDEDNKDEKYIVYEYAEKGPLSDYLNAYITFTLKEKKILFLQIAKIIQNLHLLNYCHLNINFSNFFLSRQFRLKLGNFASAKFFINNDIKSQKSQKDDIKSLGLLLLNLITDKQHLDHEKHFWDLIKLNKKEFILSQEFIDLIDAMLDNKYENRPDFQTIYNSAFFDDVRDDEDFHVGIIQVQKKFGKIDGFLHF